MVGKQKSRTRALRIHNWQVLSATLGHGYSQYYRRDNELRSKNKASPIDFETQISLCT